jgi:arsenite methyltransferase
MRVLARLACVTWSVYLPMVVAAQTQPMTPEEMHRLHQDSQAYIAALQDPARDAYQKPHDVVMALGLKDGEHVADIGAGAGYFTFRFANHVGKTGVVYGVDINPDMIAHLNRRIQESAVENVRAILAKPDDPLLPDASIDLLFICETWHHIESQSAYLTRMKTVLRPDGHVAIIDFQKLPTPVGPPQEMRVSREDLVRQFQSAGFRLEREFEFLPYQYFLLFGR